MIIRFKKEIQVKGEMKTVDAVSILGFLPNEAPEIREVSGDYKVLSGSKGQPFSIGYVTDFKSNKKEFMNLELWGGRAELLKKMAFKGMRLFVSGTIREYTYQGNDGQQKTREVLVVEDIEIIDFKKKDETSSNSNSNQGETQTKVETQTQNQNQNEQPQTVANDNPPEQIKGAEPLPVPDDLPF